MSYIIWGRDGGTRGHITDLNRSYIYLSGKATERIQRISVESIRLDRERLIILGLFKKK